MTKESYFFQPKFTFTKLGVKLMAWSLRVPKIMLFFILGVDQNIVDENHDELVEVLHEHLVHEIHEIGRGIGQSEGHHGILKKSIPCGEGSLGNV